MISWQATNLTSQGVRSPQGIVECPARQALTGLATRPHSVSGVRPCDTPVDTRQPSRPHDMTTSCPELRWTRPRGLSLRQARHLTCHSYSLSCSTRLVLCLGESPEGYVSSLSLPPPSPHSSISRVSPTLTLTDAPSGQK